MSNLFSLRGAQIKSHGRPGFDAKPVLSSIILVIRNGLPWCDAPSGHGLCKTPYNPFTRWSQTGYVQKIFAGLARSLIVGVLLTFTAASTAQAAASETQSKPKISPPEIIGTLYGGTQSEARGVSADGNVVVGYSGYKPDGAAHEYEHAFRWTNYAMEDLGTLCTNNDTDCVSSANSASRDGSVVVGISEYEPDAAKVEPDATKVYEHAFRWTEDGGIMTDLGTLCINDADCSSEAFGVSADGFVVVGSSQQDSSDKFKNHAFRWEKNIMTDLGTLCNNDADCLSEALGVSADGFVVVGWSQQDSSDKFKNHAFRWKNNIMTDLGTLDGGTQSRAYGVSADGKVVVGSSGYKPDGAAHEYEHAFRWTNYAMEDLGTLGGNKSEATGVSADGSVVVGNAQIVAGRGTLLSGKRKL